MKTAINGTLSMVHTHTTFKKFYLEFCMYRSQHVLRSINDQLAEVRIMTARKVGTLDLHTRAHKHKQTHTEQCAERRRRRRRGADTMIGTKTRTYWII